MGIYSQRGAALVVSLLILTVMTITGVVSMSASSLEARMAANSHDRDLAFQAAEYALRDGERFVQNNVLDASDFLADCTGGLCLPAAGTTAVWLDNTLNVWASGTKHKTYNYSDAGVIQKPSYIIEFLGYAPPPGWDPQTDPAPGPGDPQMFRVTALGTGATLTARVMLQSTYQKNP